MIPPVVEGHVPRQTPYPGWLVTAKLLTEYQTMKRTPLHTDCLSLLPADRLLSFIPDLRTRVCCDSHVVDGPPGHEADPFPHILLVTVTN